MEREVEKLPLLGDGGEALDILIRSSRSKLVRSLSLTLLLPLSFATLVLCLMPGPLVLYNTNEESIVYLVEATSVEQVDSLGGNQTSLYTRTSESMGDEAVDSNQTLYTINSRESIGDEAVDPVNTLAGNETLYTRILESMGFQQIRTTIRVFEFSMLFTAALIYTVASIYTLNPMTLVIPRVWKRLALTLLWFFTVVLLHTMVYIMAFLLLTYTVGFDKYVNSREFLLETIPMLGVFLCVLVYINMVGYLVSTIYLLQEQYYSLPAMRKRRRLIKGKRSSVLSLVMLYFIFNQGSGFFCYACADWNAYRRAWIVGKGVYATFLGGLLSLVMFWGLVTQTEV